MDQKIKGIYIHIPFCKSKCNYCSFYSVSGTSELLKENYITRLVEEITNSKIEAPELFSIYIGGGTPSVVGIENITRVVKALEQRFDFKLSDLKESTIEINPGTVNFQFLKTLKELGFNRISVGLQSLNVYTLEAMGRSHTVEDSIQTLEILESLGFKNVSVDLMFNYPGQDVNSTIYDIKRLDNFRCIKHYSIYSVTIEDGTKLGYQVKTGKLELNNDEIERKTYYQIRDQLEKNGFYQYEISNFSKPGFESYHNTLYWDREDYLAFGTAASASIGNTLIDYPGDLKGYIQNGNVNNVITHLSLRDEKENFMIFGLRKTRGIFDTDYSRKFGSSFFNDFKTEIKSLINQNLLKKIPDGIKLTTLGIDFYNKVALEFIK